jgi:hypothetical protein
MIKFFIRQTKNIEWNRKRELPDWAKQIFSDGMVAIGAVGADELESFISLGLENLDYYLSQVGQDKQEEADYTTAQNRYCHYQKENPHTPRVLINLGYNESDVEQFVDKELFPEL